MRSIAFNYELLVLLLISFLIVFNLQICDWTRFNTDPIHELRSRNIKNQVKRIKSYQKMVFFRIIVDNFIL